MVVYFDVSGIVTDVYLDVITVALSSVALSVSKGKYSERKKDASAQSTLSEVT